MKKNASKDAKSSFEKFVGTAELDKKMLSTVGGSWPGQGYFSTISGECSKSRTSCWDIFGSAKAVDAVDETNIAEI